MRLKFDVTHIIGTAIIIAAACLFVWGFTAPRGGGGEGGDNGGGGIKIDIDLGPLKDESDSSAPPIRPRCC